MNLIYGLEEEKHNPSLVYITENNLQTTVGIEIYENPTKTLNEISSSIVNGKKLYELFQFEDFSIWWFLYPSLYPSIQRITNFIINFSKILDAEKPESVIVKGDFSKLNLIKQICKNKNIKTKYSKIDFVKFQSKNKLIHKTQKPRYAKITHKKILQRKTLFDKKTPININDKILFLTPTSYRREQPDLLKSGKIKGEYIQDSIVKILQKLNYDIVGIDLDYSFKGDFSILEERLNDSTPWMPIEYFFDDTVNFDSFLNTYNEIINDEKFQKQFKFQKIDFWNNVKNEFEKFLLLPNLPVCLKIFFGMKNIFNNQRPKAIFLPYETGPYALAVILACEHHNVMTIGLQHGIIFENNSDYSHNIFRTKKTKLGFPLPDQLLLFGNYTKNLLEQNKYPLEKLRVFGHPEFFYHDEKKFDVNQLKDKLKVPKNKKIILFATSKMQSYYHSVGKLDYDEKLLQKLLDVYGTNNDFHIILKPHPDEFTKTYEDLIIKSNSQNFSIKQGNLHELLVISDVVVSIFSSIIIDSLIFKKPTIRVTFPSGTPLIPFSNYDVIIETKMDSIPSVIEDIFSNSDVINKLSKNRLLFLQDHYNINNKSPEEDLEKFLRP